MKKSILMLLAVVMLFAVSSCKDDEDLTTNKKQIIIDNLWKLTSVESENESTELDLVLNMIFGFVTIEYDFQNNGVYEIITSSPFTTVNDVETGTWSISDDNKTLTIDGGVYAVEQYTETTLKIKSGPENIQIGEDISGYDTGDVTLVFTAVAD